METIYQPTKEQIRQWLVERRRGHVPLPDAEAIRVQLGWELVSGTSASLIAQASPSDERLAA